MICLSNKTQCKGYGGATVYITTTLSSFLCDTLLFFVLRVARAHFLRGLKKKKKQTIVRLLSVRSFGFIHGMKIAVCCNSLARY